jgi:hypothetical protein
MRAPEEGMATYRIEVGHANGVKPGNIVGAIANEAASRRRKSAASRSTTTSARWTCRPTCRRTCSST